MMVQRRLLDFIRFARLPFALTVLSGVAASGAAIVGGFALAEALRAVLAGELGHTGPLAVAASMVVARLGLLWLRDVCATWTAARVKVRLRSSLMDRLFSLGPGAIVRRRTGDIQATLVDGVEALQAYLGFYLPQALISIAVPSLVIGFLAAVDPLVALVTAFGVAAVPLSRRLWRKLLGERGSRHWEMYEEYAARTTDAIHGMSTLVALGAAERHGERLAREAEELRKATTRNLAASLGVYTVTATAMGIGTAMAVALAATRGSLGVLDAAAVLLVLFLTGESFRPLTDLQNYWHEGFYGLAAANGIFAILDATPEVCEPARPHTGTLADPPAVALRGVTFSYPDSGRTALADVGFEVPAGATLALVGRSGAGKSTVTHLVQRFFDPDRGEIEIDGTDIRQLELGRLREMIAMVSQDVVLFHGTIRHNLTIARPDASDDELRRVVREAALDDVIARLPGGLDAQVGERGAQLSGGERQRVAIARALLRNAPILILDEATSNLDGVNEALIGDALAKVRAGRTTIVVAHRLSTIAAADLVAVLDDGCLVEFGPPAELARSNGHWARLVAGQRLPVSR